VFAAFGYAILLVALSSGWLPDIMLGWVLFITVLFVAGLIYIFNYRSKPKFYKVSQSRKEN
jgi:hypothetical protein